MIVLHYDFGKKEILINPRLITSMVKHKTSKATIINMGGDKKTVVEDLDTVTQKIAEGIRLADIETVRNVNEANILIAQEKEERENEITILHKRLVNSSDLKEYKEFSDEEYLIATVIYRVNSTGEKYEWISDPISNYANAIPILDDWQRNKEWEQNYTTMKTEEFLIYRGTPWAEYRQEKAKSAEK